MRNRSGFTLVETLAVIGIITVVAAILFPVFLTVRERGRRTSCQSNLRQLAMGIQMYVHDNDGYYPLLEWQYPISLYVRNEEVFCCPDNPQNYTSAGSGRLDYAYDIGRLDVFPPPFPSKNVHGISDAGISFPADTWVNMDIVWIDRDGSQHFGREVTTSCGRKSAGNTLHSGGGNYSFTDGHVRWLTPEQFGEIDCAAGPLPPPFNH